MPPKSIKIFMQSLSLHHSIPQSLLHQLKLTNNNTKIKMASEMGMSMQAGSSSYLEMHPERKISEFFSKVKKHVLPYGKAEQCVILVL